jgi:hypothetical protein
LVGVVHAVCLRILNSFVSLFFRSFVVPSIVVLEIGLLLLFFLIFLTFLTFFDYLSFLNLSSLDTLLSIADSRAVDAGSSDDRARILGGFGDGTVGPFFGGPGDGAHIGDFRAVGSDQVADNWVSGAFAS